MKPSDLLADNKDFLESEGRKVIRKGTAGAFMMNVKLIESGTLAKKEHDHVLADLLEIVPALNEIGFFDVFAIRSEKIRKLLQEKGFTLS